MEKTKENENDNETKTDDDDNVPSNFKLYFVVTSCFLANLTMGLVLGYSAVLLPQLEVERGNLSRSEASMIASFSNLGQIFTAIFASFLASHFGRKKTIISLCSISASGFIITAFSTGITWVLVVSRVLQGAAIVCSIVQVYISEVSHVKLRGFFGALGTVGISLGITVVYVLGALLNWTHVAFVCAQFPLLCLFLMIFFCPESPSWLFSKDMKSEAERVLKWLRGNKYDLSEELKTLEAVNVRNELTEKVGLAEILLEFKRKSVVKACALLVALMTLMMANGGTVIVFYAVDIMQNLNSGGNSYVPAILVSIFRLVGNVLGMILLRKFVGKKNLLTVTSCIMSVSVALLGLQIHFEERLREWTDDNVAIMSYLPILMLVIYMVSFGAGPATIPWTLQGELVPPKVAPYASGISVITSIGSLYILTQLYPFMEQLFTLAGTFWFYAFMSLLMALVSAFFLPETNGKNSKEILAHFEK